MDKFTTLLLVFLASSGVSVGNKCTFHIGEFPKETFDVGEEFKYDHGKFKCLRFKCDSTGKVDLLEDKSGCSFNDECVPVNETKPEGECGVRVCGINFDKFKSSAVLEMDMYVSPESKCEWDNECVSIGETKYNQTDCMRVKCSMLNADFGGNEYAVKTYWKPDRLDCPNAGKCVEKHKTVVKDCSTLTCVSDDVNKDNTTTFKRGLVATERKCKVGLRCLPVGEKYKSAKCLESVCEADGMLKSTFEGCNNFMTGNCSALGEIISPVPCVEFNCTFTPEEKSYGFKMIKQGCESKGDCVIIGAKGHDPLKKCERRCGKEMTPSGAISFRYEGECL